MILKVAVEGALAAGFTRAVWVTVSRRQVFDHPIVKIQGLEQVWAALGIRSAQPV